MSINKILTIITFAASIAAAPTPTAPTSPAVFDMDYPGFGAQRAEMIEKGDNVSWIAAELGFKEGLDSEDGKKHALLSVRPASSFEYKAQDRSFLGSAVANIVPSGNRESMELVFAAGPGYPVTIVQPDNYGYVVMTNVDDRSAAIFQGNVLPTTDGNMLLMFAVPVEARPLFSIEEFINLLSHMSKSSNILASCTWDTMTYYSSSRQMPISRFFSFKDTDTYLAAICGYTPLVFNQAEEAILMRDGVAKIVRTVHSQQGGEQGFALTVSTSNKKLSVGIGAPEASSSIDFSEAIPHIHNMSSIAHKLSPTVLQRIIEEWYDQYQFDNPLISYAGYSGPGQYGDNLALPIVIEKYVTDAFKFGHKIDLPAVIGEASKQLMSVTA